MDTTEVKVGGRLALACGRCGELILFLGRARDWYEAGDAGRPRSSRAAGAGRGLPWPTAW